LECWDNGEHRLTALVEAPSIRYKVSKKLSVLHFETEIARELQLAEALGVKAANRDVHHPELALLASELFIAQGTGFELAEQKSMQELVNVGQATLSAGIREQHVFFVFCCFLPLLDGFLGFPAMLVALLMSHLVLLGEEKAEVHAFLVLQLVAGLLDFWPAPDPAVFVVIFEVEPRVHIVRSYLVASRRMYHFRVRFQLVLTLESHVTLIFAVFVGAQVVRLVEVFFETRVVRVVVALVEIVAQVAGQMQALQVVQEDLVVVIELLAEVTPRVRQDFRALFAAWVAVLDVLAKFLSVIDPLLPDEHSAACQANLTESLLMHLLHVSAKRINVRERLT